MVEVRTGASVDGAVPVTEAARRLGLTRRRVLTLIHDGKLDARPLGSSWVVDIESLERRKRIGPLAGRHFSPRRAWGVLFLADGLETPWLDPVSSSKLRAYLKVHPLARLSPRLDGRGRATGYRAHPSDIARILLEPDLMLSGGSAAVALKLGLSDPGRVDAYAATAVIDRLGSAYQLRPGRQANVILRRLPDLGADWSLRRVAPRSAVALDLAEDDDPRARQVGLALLAAYS